MQARYGASQRSGSRLLHTEAASAHRVLCALVCVHVVTHVS